MSTNDINQNLTNLASPKIGTKIIEVSDDFFGKASRMLDDKAPVFIEDKYDEHGKWMDGWAVSYTHLTLPTTPYV